MEVPALQVRTVSRRWSIFTAGLAALAVLAVVLGRPAPASAHWAGFTGTTDVFCLQAFAPGGYCEYNVRHTYGATRARHQDIGVGSAYVEAGGNGWYSSQTAYYRRLSLAPGNPGEAVTACYNGTYPNCHDQDTYWIRPYIYLSAFNSSNHILAGRAYY